ncbi:helix-turn-helix transcriptional regulator [Methylobacter sp. Wu1]|uniref:PadR family transcriptional regulator n=1 Tax=Methylobacter sp. Wu1 TaxID=3119359 RepID=UPI002F927CF2
MHGLEKKGYLCVERAVVNGKIRKYYRITDRGRVALEDIKPKLRELMAEVLGDQGSANGSGSVE